MEYKVIYYVGEDMNFKTVANVGVIAEEKKGTYFRDKKGNKTEIKGIKDVKLIDVNCLGKVIKISTKGKNNIYIAVYKGMCIANFLVRLDEEKTQELEKRFILKKDNKVI